MMVNGGRSDSDSDGIAGRPFYCFSSYFLTCHELRSISVLHGYNANHLIALVQFRFPHRSKTLMPMLLNYEIARPLDTLDFFIR